MASKSITKPDYQKEFIRTFEKLSFSYGQYDAWDSFIVMSACTISNICDHHNRDAREKMYLDHVSRFKREDVPLFAELLAITVSALWDNPEQDFLGTIFSRLKLNNHWNGQFFTPYNVSSMMAEMTLSDKFENPEHFPISVSDPCCGAGCLFIAAANAAFKRGIDVKNDLIFLGQDIDLTAALMCYIQLSVLGLKAFIKVGNSLTDPITENEKHTEYIWISPKFAGINFISLMCEINNLFTLYDKTVTLRNKNAS